MTLPFVLLMFIYSAIYSAYLTHADFCPDVWLWSPHHPLFGNRSIYGDHRDLIYTDLVVFSPTNSTFRYVFSLLLLFFQQR